ncbi:MAG: hypothetical protein ACOYOQ_00275 [Microthrixaceae bacterium]
MLVFSDGSLTGTRKGFDQFVQQMAARGVQVVLHQVTMRVDEEACASSDGCGTVLSSGNTDHEEEGRNP